ncbi:hypothetical protein E2C01_080934 [Portunus trituberculatus]|uniref:Uncharacterized protein n=1 Tax=Portunus trituberculatus TaxID=210409 RepID=A0A5B7IZP5_PORTR|nr:hypothetical protein [Portunus trituberculatus]
MWRRAHHALQPTRPTPSSDCDFRLTLSSLVVNIHLGNIPMHNGPWRLHVCRFAAIAGKMCVHSAPLPLQAVGNVPFQGRDTTWGNTGGAAPTRRLRETTAATQ